MTGFVRAVAIAERSILGGVATGGEPAVDVVDDARRHGLRVILVSGRSLGELRRGGDTLLPHFDAVVAEAGAALRVGSGPSRRLPVSSSAALLEALAELDVDPHDALGISGDPADAELLGSLEVAVRPGGSASSSAPPDGATVDYVVPGLGADALRRVLDDARAGRPAISPARHDIRVQASGGPGAMQVRVPGAHANVAVCAAGEAHWPDLPARLVAAWVGEGYSTLVVDLHGRYRGGASLDPTARGWLEDLASVTRGRGKPAVVALGDVHGARRSALVAETLTAVRRGRARTGRPHWLVLDPAAPFFSDPDLPPESLDLADAGYCLVLRDHADYRWSPANRRPAIDTVLPCGPQCPLAST